MCNGGVYKIINIQNEKIYVGSSKNIRSRWYKHLFSLRHNMHHSKLLQNDYNAFGEENFKIEIIEALSTELKEQEQYWIDYYKSYDTNIGYNVLSKSDSFLGYKHTDVTKQKISKAFSGQNHPLYGKHHSDESKEKNRQSNRGRKMSDEFCDKMKIKNKGEGNPRAKLKVNDVVAIKDLIKQNKSNKEISSLFNVTPNMVQRIRTNKAWKSIE